VLIDLVFETDEALGVGAGLALQHDEAAIRQLIGIAGARTASSSDKASAGEIQNDFNFLTNHKGLGKFPASQLAKYTTLELADDETNRLLDQDLAETVRIAKAELPDLGSYPIECQAALIDIAFNVGNFVSFRPTIVSAIKGQGLYAKKTLLKGWKAAAAHHVGLAEGVWAHGSAYHRCRPLETGLLTRAGEKSSLSATLKSPNGFTPALPQLRKCSLS
jgi:hypothetical protein